MIINKKRLNSRKVILLILLIIILIVLFINIDEILKFVKNQYKNIFNNKSDLVIVSNNIESFENMNNLEESFESFVDLPPFKTKLELEIIKDTNSIKVSFPTIDLTSKPNYMLKGYILALAKYDYNLVKQDEVSINVSNEYNNYSIEINNIIDNSSITGTELKTKYKNYKNNSDFESAIAINSNLTSLADSEKSKYKFFVAKYFVESGRDSLYNVIHEYLTSTRLVD
jgi:cell division protein FtsB